MMSGCPNAAKIETLQLNDQNKPTNLKKVTWEQKLRNKTETNTKNLQH